MRLRRVVRVGLRAGALLVAAVPWGASARAQLLERWAFEEAHMGTEFRIVLYAPDSAVAAEAARAAFATVADLDARLSDYRPDSEIARLARAGAPYPVSDAAWEVLSLARWWAERTDGAFDPTVGPLTRLWRWSARRGELPDPERLAAARAAVGYEGLRLDPERRTAELARAGMALDLGGLAKGYAADAALEELARLGVHVALVDAGGDLALGAPPPAEAGWRVALPGGEVARLARCGVATSGDVYRVAEVDGVRYSHRVDPATGLGAEDAPTVTVIAPDAVTADVLATALGLMERTAAVALVRGLPGVSARVDGPRGWREGHHKDDGP